LIDGYNLIFRCFYGINSPLNSPQDGMPTQALYGWLRAVWRLQDAQRANRSLAFFDLGPPARQLALHPEYKAQRKPTPEGLVQQVPWIKVLCQAMGTTVIERHGTEADELLAATARHITQSGAADKAIIVSADKDFAQVLEQDRIIQLLPPAPGHEHWQVLQANDVVAKWGVRHTQMADWLALVGDAADNIPGLPGVGPKTACQWLGHYGSLENLLEATATADTAVQGPIAQRFLPLIAQHRDLLLRNKALVQFEYPPLDPLPAAPAPDVAALRKLLTTWGMHAGLKELDKRYPAQSDFLSALLP
jgi:DNA polymerase-1